ncbi:MAG: tetratricopeptide repeat protein [Planctomycetes bacterium]|nr:tetratricopeptide repeat protein [Planctomycetota bacterium]
MVDSRAFDATRLLVHALLGSGKFAMARDILRGMLETAPDDAGTRRNLVRAHLGLGEYAEAEPAARVLAEQEAGDDRLPALFFHAHALWGCGRTVESRAVVDRYAALLHERADGKG